MKQVNQQALDTLKGARPYIHPLQYRTLRGQVLAGDAEGAMRGLRKIQRRASDGTRLGRQQLRP